MKDKKLSGELVQFDIEEQNFVSYCYKNISMIKDILPFFTFFNKKNHTNSTTLWRRKITQKIRVVLFFTFDTKSN